ncbi:MAG: hypothetical protein MUD01_28875 [Chloroflexaceae bacterium]|jgi:hypothetical protein|nr:hypothetical protein [Chloroflexaceae bacterium]
MFNTRVILSIIGLVLIFASLFLMFQGQALWGWALLAVAFGCSWAARKV